MSQSFTYRFDLRLLALLVAALAACGGVIDDPSSSSAEPIINGQADATHSAVVALIYQGEQFCTGTLITPRAILTAGHCLEESGYPPARMSAFFGQKVGGSGTTIPVASGAAHPSWYVASNGAPIYDVAVLLLTKDAPVTPMAWQSTALPNIVGKSTKMVGYGVTNAYSQSGNGTRRSVAEAITKQDSGFIYYGDGRDGTCQGDSGGPTLYIENGVETVIAVTSYGDSSCVNLGANTRVDTYASFINKMIGSSSSGAATSTGICGTTESYGDTTIDSCMNSHCCTSFNACYSNATCQKCMVKPSGSGCSTNTKFKALNSCMNTNKC